jgi:hypothetical protein
MQWLIISHEPPKKERVTIDEKFDLELSTQQIVIADAIDYSFVSEKESPRVESLAKWQSLERSPGKIFDLNGPSEEII